MSRANLSPDCLPKNKGPIRSQVIADIDYNSKVSIPGLSGFSGEEMGEKVGE